MNRRSLASRMLTCVIAATLFVSCFAMLLQPAEAASKKKSYKLPTQVTEYEYNAKKKKYVRIASLEIEYDKHGNPKKIIQTNYDNTCKSTFKNTYKNKKLSKVVMKVFYIWDERFSNAPNDKKPDYIKTATYDKKGRMTKLTEKYYGEAGHRIKNPKKEIIATYSKYNAKGHFTRCMTGSENYAIKYTYHKNGVIKSAQFGWIDEEGVISSMSGDTLFYNNDGLFVRNYDTRVKYKKQKGNITRAYTTIYGGKYKYKYKYVLKYGKAKTTNKKAYAEIMLSLTNNVDVNPGVIPNYRCTSMSAHGSW